MLCGSRLGKEQIRKRLPAFNNLELSGQEIGLPPIDDLAPLPEMPKRLSISEQIHELRANQNEFNISAPNSISDSSEVMTNKALVFAYVPETQKLEAKLTFSNISTRKLISWISTLVSLKGRFKIPISIGVINPEQRIATVVSADPSAFGPTLEPLMGQQIVINTVPWQAGLNKMADILSHQKKSIKNNTNIQTAVISKLFVYRTPAISVANDLEAIDSIMEPTAELIREEEIHHLNDKIAKEEQKKCEQISVQERTSMTEVYKKLLSEIWVSGPPKLAFKAMTHDLMMLNFLLVLIFGTLWYIH